MSCSLWHFLSLQDVSNFPDLQCDGREHGPAEDVLEPPVLSDHLQQRRAGGVSDRRHVLSTGMNFETLHWLSVLSQTHESGFNQQQQQQQCVVGKCLRPNTSPVNVTVFVCKGWFVGNLSTPCRSSRLQGVGTVVSGTTLRGLIRLNDTLLLGPDPLGTFIPIAVKSIHRKRMPVREVRGGQTASFALKKVWMHVRILPAAENEREEPWRKKVNYCETFWM